MLVELAIANFAIIDRLQLRLADGFNALTGETGAGKSIIIDAVSAMLGAKIGPEFVRHGTNTARVEGLFDLTRLSPVAVPTLAQALRQAGLLGDAEDDGETAAPADTLDEPTLVLSREIHSSGRTVARINGSLVNLATLREIGELLIDIHGQTEHQSLLRVPTHLDLLDQYADLAPLRAEVAVLVTRLRGVRTELARLQRDERELARRADLLKYQVEEIEKAALVEGEDADLTQERVRLSNAERLGSLADSIYALLIAGGEAEGSFSANGRTARRAEVREGGVATPVRDALGEALRHLQDLTRLDPALGAQEQTLTELRETIEEVGREIRLYRETVEADPARLLEVEERLGLIHNLKRKYAPTIPEINAYGQAAAAELDTLSHSEERIADLQAEEAVLVAETGALAGDLSAQRREAADRLARAVEQAMADLLMGDIKFEVNFAYAPDAQGVPIMTPEGRERTVAVDTRGVDRVEFLISPNPGEPLKPLSKIASGGETSRLMLALKSILSAADATPTLIFDEIDVGVGGRSGAVVGEKLWSLTGNHQVICITHLPQIAAFADTHYKITKQVRDNRTSTHVDALPPDERVREIAAMLGGVLTPAQLANARDILRQTAHIRALRGGATASDLLGGEGNGYHPAPVPADPAWPVVAGRPLSS